MSLSFFLSLFLFHSFRERKKFVLTYNTQTQTAPLFLLLLLLLLRPAARPTTARVLAPLRRVPHVLDVVLRPPRDELRDRRPFTAHLPVQANQQLLLLLRPALALKEKKKERKKKIDRGSECSIREISSHLKTTWSPLDISSHLKHGPH